VEYFISMHFQLAQTIICSSKHCLAWCFCSGKDTKLHACTHAVTETCSDFTASHVTCACCALLQHIPGQFEYASCTVSESEKFQVHWHYSDHMRVNWYYCGVSRQFKETSHTYTLFLKVNIRCIHIVKFCEYTEQTVGLSLFFDYWCFYFHH